MRLERAIYERIFNTKLLGRARNIATPARHVREDDYYLGMTPSFRISRLFDGFWRWVYAKEWNFQRQGALQRGMTMEDFHLYDEEDFRRSPFHEHVLREATHPYQQLLHGWRRSRYFKVDMAMKGFEAPQYLKEEANKRTYIDSFVNIFGWRHFVESNYYSDMTPITTLYNGSRTILELFILYGFASRSAWNRYFFNEEKYYDLDKCVEDMKAIDGSYYKNYDLSKDENVEGWRKSVIAWHKQFPGYFAPEGEDVDFEALKIKFENIKTELGLDSLNSDDLTSIGIKYKLNKKLFVMPEYKDEDAKGSSNVGLDMPKFVQRPSERAFMN